MRRLAPWILCCFFALGAVLRSEEPAPPKEKPSLEDDQKQLQGKWKFQADQETVALEVTGNRLRLMLESRKDGAFQRQSFGNFELVEKGKQRLLRIGGELVPYRLEGDALFLTFDEPPFTGERKLMRIKEK
jgi:hypothetical protein